MKRFLIASTVALICIAVLPSCKKDKTPPPIDLSGTTWTGSGTVSTIPVTMSLTMNSNGTLTGAVTTSSDFAVNGSWSKSPTSNVVNMMYTISTVTGSYSAQSTLNADNNRLENGVGTNSSTASYNMVFSLTRQ